MFSVLDAPWLNKAEFSFRTKLKAPTTQTVKCALTSFTPSTTIATGTTDYGDGTVQTFRTKSMRGILVPEEYYGQYLTLQGDVAIAQNSRLGVRVTGTGAITAVYRSRFVFPYALPAGVTVGNFKLHPIGTTSGADGGAGTVGKLSEATNTGATGTHSIVANFGLLSSAGSATQIATATQSRNITSVASGDVIYVADTSTDTSDDDDFLYLEIVLTVTQTARTSGSGGICALIGTGYANAVTTNLLGDCMILEFDLT